MLIFSDGRNVNSELEIYARKKAKKRYYKQKNEFNLTYWLKYQKKRFLYCNL